MNAKVRTQNVEYRIPMGGDLAAPYSLIHSVAYVRKQTATDQSAEGGVPVAAILLITIPYPP